MDQSSNEKRYEDAARYRDQLAIVTEFAKKQKKISQDFKDRDVLVMASENSYGVGLVLRIRNGHVLGREKFYLKVYDPESNADNLAQFFLQYYSSTMDIPDEILIECLFDDLNIYLTQFFYFLWVVFK